MRTIRFGARRFAAAGALCALFTVVPSAEAHLLDRAGIGGSGIIQVPAIVNVYWATSHGAWDAAAKNAPNYPGLPPTIERIDALTRAMGWSGYLLGLEEYQDGAAGWSIAPSVVLGEACPNLAADAGPSTTNTQQARNFIDGIDVTCILNAAGGVSADNVLINWIYPPQMVGGGDGPQSGLCSSTTAAYHDHGAGVPSAYIVTNPACKAGGANAGIASIIANLSHEDAEAITDTQPTQNLQGWKNTLHLWHWAYEEVCDLCENGSNGPSAERRYTPFLSNLLPGGGSVLSNYYSNNLDDATGTFNNACWSGSIDPVISYPGWPANVVKLPTPAVAATGWGPDMSVSFTFDQATILNAKTAPDALDLRFEPWDLPLAAPVVVTFPSVPAQGAPQPPTPVPDVSSLTTTLPGFTALIGNSRPELWWMGPTGVQAALQKGLQEPFWFNLSPPTVTRQGSQTMYLRATLQHVSGPSSSIGNVFAGDLVQFGNIWTDGFQVKVQGIQATHGAPFPPMSLTDTLLFTFTMPATGAELTVPVSPPSVDGQRTVCLMPAGASPDLGNCGSLRAPLTFGDGTQVLIQTDLEGDLIAGETYVSPDIAGPGQVLGIPFVTTGGALDGRTVGAAFPLQFATAGQMVLEVDDPGFSTMPLDVHPQVTAVYPNDNVSANMRVTLVGAGFTPSNPARTSVMVGNVTAQNLYISPDGTQLTFSLPSFPAGQTVSVIASVDGVASTSYITVTYGTPGSGMQFTTPLQGQHLVPPYAGGVPLQISTNEDIGPTPYYIEIYDVTAGQLLGLCGTGTSCTAMTAGESDGTTHEFQAVLAQYNLSYPPLGVVETASQPEWITRSSSGDTLQLSTPSAQCSTSEVVTATANIDVGPTPYYIGIFDTNGTRLTECGGGTSCSATLACGDAAVAFISSWPTTLPPQNIQTSSNTVAAPPAGP
jgi:hypothetical protein